MSGLEESFATRLVAWQRAYGRQSLPWQQLDEGGTRDPYRIWIAEIMLQQTQVAAALPYYVRFLERFPDVATLASAPADDVMQRWSGLGYYSRARNLHDAARRIVSEHGGVLPSTVEALVALPGVGRSTAAAIAAFGYGVRAAILDGNVKRVLARAFAIDGVVSSTTTTRTLWALADRLVPSRDVERYTQGLMDLGATVCVPREPRCLACPFADDCRARREGRVDELPVRAAKRVAPRRRATLLEVVDRDRVWLERRPPTGVWGGLWSLPEVDGQGAEAYAGRLGPVVSRVDVAGFTHAFTHYVLEAAVVRVVVSPDAAPRVDDHAGGRWVARDRLSELGLATPIRRHLERYSIPCPTR